MKIDPNNVPEGAVALPVSDGTWTLVDADVAEALAGRKLRRHGKYVSLSGQKDPLFLHHVVAGMSPGREIHHCNAVRDDNRRQNLLHVTRSEHQRLQPKVPLNPTGFRGVNRMPGTSRFRACTRFDEKVLRTLSFREPLLAALYRDDLLAGLRLVGARAFETTISRARLLALLDSTAGRFFTVWFVKRTNGEIRRMTCRLRKKADSKGLKFDPRAVGLITVWDVQAREYRCINLEGVLCLRMVGKSYRVEHRRALAA